MMLLVIAGLVMLTGCSHRADGVGNTKKRVQMLTDPDEDPSFIPIIYPDKVVELNPRTGEERVIPDEDLIVEDGKVWGRYIRFGPEVKYTMSYSKNLCATAINVDIDTIGETSKPIRSFAIPERKFDDCEEVQVKSAVKRIERNQVEYETYNREALKKLAPPAGN